MTQLQTERVSLWSFHALETQVKVLNRITFDVMSRHLSVLVETWDGNLSFVIRPQKNNKKKQPSSGTTTSNNRLVTLELL